MRVRIAGHLDWSQSEHGTVEIRRLACGESPAVTFEKQAATLALFASDTASRRYRTSAIAGDSFGVALVGDGRFDNLEDVRGSLGETTAQTTAELLIRAYLAWGVMFP